MITNELDGSPIKSDNVYFANNEQGSLVFFIAHAEYNIEHVYMRPEVNSNRFEISNRFEMPFRLHGNLH